MTPNRSLKRKLLAIAIAATLSPAAQAVDYEWLSGNYSGPNPLLAGDRLLGQGVDLKNFSGIAFTNQGTVVWQTASRIGFVSSTVTNSGLWDMQADADLTYVGGVVSIFINDDRFRKSAGAGSTVIGTNIAFVNNGTVEAQTGTIDFAGGSAIFHAGTVFAGAGVNRISNSASFLGAFTSDNLVLAGGNFIGDNTTPAALNGSVAWTGGSFAGTWQVAAGQTLRALDGADKNFSGVNFTNSGSVVWQSGERIGLASSNVVNQGLWDLQTDASLNYIGGVVSTFVNDGSLRKSGGTGSSVIGGNVAFVNNGTVEAQTGTIDFAGGSVRFQAGTQFIGAGVNRISNNANFVGAFSSDNLVLAGGNFIGDNSTPAVLNGGVAWSGGSFAGVWQVAAGQTLTALDGADKNFSGVNFTNSGSVVWQSGQRIGLASSNVVNQGLWDLQTDASLAYVGSIVPTFVNDGSLRKSGGTGSSVIGGNVAFVNNGTVEAQTGTIDFAGGSVRFQAGTQFIGAGVNRISNNANFVGAFSSDNLVLAGGNFIGDNSTPAVLNGGVAWSGGSFAGTWQVAAGQTLRALDGADKNFSGVNFTNSGSVVWQSGQRIGLASSNVVNQGLWDLQTDASLAYVGSIVPTFVNDGSLRKSGGTGSSVIGGNVAFVNNGTVEAQTGTIDFAGGSVRFQAGTQFIGAGVNRISNNANFVGAFSSDNLVLAGGNFIGDNSTPAVLNGGVAWTGGSFAGTWQVGAGQTLTALDGADKNFSGVNFTNEGTVAWEGSERVGFVSATVVNAGLFDIQSDADLSYAGGLVSSFVNAGTLRKSAGSETTSIAALIGFSNPGRIEALSGTLQLPGSFVNPGMIAGTATVQTTVLTNNGHVAPGASVGTLTLAGSFVQGAAGFFDVDLNTVANSDLLVVTGTATLGGTLALNCFGACSMAVGEEVRILDASGPLSGSFTDPPTLTGFATGGFEIFYDAPNGDVWLRVTETVTAVPEPGTWALMFAGLALIAAAVRRHRG